MFMDVKNGSLLFIKALLQFTYVVKHVSVSFQASMHFLLLWADDHKHDEDDILSRPYR